VRRLLPVVLIVIIAGSLGYWFYGRRPPQPPAAGIPNTLAEDRAGRIKDLQYDVTFSVPAKRDAPIAAHLSATFMLSDKSRPLSFDFAQPVEKLLAMHANTNIIEPAVASGHIVIPTSALLQGLNTVEFEFIAGDAPLNRADDFLYALFVPARASQTIPVFDQPDLKARWRLILNIPKDWVAVSNG